MTNQSLPLLRPAFLQAGDEVRVIAPSKSLAIISEENRNIATRCLEKLGLKVSFGQHVLECDLFGSSSIASRVEDLHDAFLDPNVKGILPVIGGYNCNQLLSKIDYDLIREHPKFFCGYSDITALQNAFLARSGLLSYSGPHYSTLAMQNGLEYTLESFKNMAFVGGSYSIDPSKTWSSDQEWYLDQENRTFEVNHGPEILCEGAAEGRIIGGNLGTFLLLKGTSYMPSLNESILFVEDTESGSKDVEFDRNLQSVIDLPDFSSVKALVIGRFENTSNIDSKRLEAIIHNKSALAKIPVIANVDFGHTTPFFTFPIGGKARVLAKKNKAIRLEIEA